MVKYRVEKSRWHVIPKIEEVEVIKENAKQVVVISKRKDWHTGKERVYENRNAKDSEYYCYCDTWEAAHEYLTAEAQRQVDSARLALEQAKGDQCNVKGMKKPAEG